MSYDRNAELPKALRENLRARAKYLSRNVQQCLAEYAARDDRETVGHRVAWMTVNRRKAGSRRVAVAL